MNVCSQGLEITWQDPESITHRTSRESRDELDRRRIVIPYVVQPHKRRRKIILPEITKGYLRPIERVEQQKLVRSIAQGRAWLQAVLAGTTISALAQREKKSERMIRMMLSLAFLDPQLIRAALHGTLPRGISTRRLIDAPIGWHDQWREIGLSRPS